jgi:catechol 2,3-dioxygenase-like lactoylglutathione lyase family enzyme
LRLPFAVAALGSAAVLAIASGNAAAYPQFQMSREQTCTGCHVSPAGGGLLNENGLAVSESISQWGTPAEFFYGKIPAPSWLMLGGDLRGATGYVQTPEKLFASFPMQIEAYANALLGSGVSLRVVAGSRASQIGSESTTFAWSREHYLMWQQNPDDNTGLYVRAGRFMPVFGLRLAEHRTYIRRWGGTPLYGDTYGLAVEYIEPGFEVHATGFIKDPILDTPEHDNGGALLGELRIDDHLSVGAEGMYTRSADDQKFWLGALARLYLESPAVLVSFEGQFMNQLIEPRGAPKQIIAYLLASRFVTPAIMVDLGLGFFNENIQITKLHREAIDLNVHWFATSHIEAIFTGRFETLAFGASGPNAGYALAQLHYRL